MMKIRIGERLKNIVKNTHLIIHQRTPSPSTPCITPRSADPIPPAAHESAPHLARHGRTAAEGRAGGEVLENFSTVLS